MDPPPAPPPLEISVVEAIERDADITLDLVGQTRGSVDIPDGATEMDVTGRTILPGYVDTHAHPHAHHDAVPHLRARRLGAG